MSASATQGGHNEHGTATEHEMRNCYRTGNRGVITAFDGLRLQYQHPWCHWPC